MKDQDSVSRVPDEESRWAARKAVTARQAVKVIMLGISLCARGFAVMVLFNWFVAPAFHVSNLLFLPAIWAAVFITDIMVPIKEPLPDVRDQIGFSIRCLLIIGFAWVVKSVPWLYGVYAR